MNRSAKKGKCSNCKVCKAYLREAGRNQVKKEGFFIKGENPVLTPLAERVIKADQLATEKLLQTEDEISGYPTH